MLSGSGHIAGVVNPPDRKKYQYWTGGPAVGDIEDWIETAEEHPGLLVAALELVDPARSTRPRCRHASPAAGS